MSKLFPALSTFFLFILGFLSLVAAAQVNVYTRSYDNSRTGANLQETILTPALVNPTNFGKLFTVPTDGQIYAQPLYVSNLAIAGGTHNVVFVASMLNTVYALDADTGATLWTQNFGSPIIPQDVENNQNIVWATRLGILATPVIDPGTNTMYFVSGSQPADGSLVFGFNLNAIDITTGLPVSGSPLVFNPQLQNPRPALALANGNVYIAFASHEDTPPYHGFVMAYSASTLAQTAVYSDTTTGTLGGIWTSGQAPAIDAAGNLYYSTGNGSFGTTPNNLVQTGNSFIKLSPSLQLLDYFTPYNSATMNAGDMDLGSSGVLLIPNTTYVLGGGKQGILYLTDSTAMGGYNAASDQVRQEFQAVYGNGTSHIHGGPMYLNSDQNGPTTYVWGENDVLRGFLFNATTGLLNPAPFAMSTMTAPVTNNDGAMPGGFLSASANGNSNGIVWASTPYNGDAAAGNVQGVLYAFNADTLAPLWSDKTNDARDEIGLFAKYVPPVVANGKLYMASFGALGTSDGSGALVVYGLLKPELTVNVGNATMAPGAALPTFTGTVSGLVNGDTLGSTIVVTYSTTATSSSPAGTYPITATVSGSSANNYLAVVNAGTLTIAATAATTTSLTAPATSTYGANITLTATVASTAGVPTGTVTFSSGATALGTGTLNGSGVATLSTSALALGADAVTASYAGSGNFTASTSAASNVSVAQAAQTITFPAVTARPYGSAPFSVSATSSAGSGYPVTITVQSGPAAISGGVVTLTGAGTVVLLATQPGNADFSPATATQSFQVTAASTTTTLSAPANAASGASVALTATVSSSAGTPGGTVAFLSASANLGMGTLNASGSATLNTTALAAGTDSVTAVYAAAGNFAASTSPAVAIIVSAAPVSEEGSYSLNATPSSLTAKAGAAANTMLTISPTGGYSDTLSLSCSNVPSYVSCVFAPKQVSLTGNNQSVNVGLTLQTTAQSAVKQNPSGAPLPTALLALAFWWPGSLTGIAVFRRQRKLVKSGFPGQICLLLGCTLAFAAGLSGCGTSGNVSSAPSPINAQVTVACAGSSASDAPQTVVLNLTITQ